ncbi:cytochrome c oxidase accessory protein CcoG [Parvularcula sp. LCG005]|uniref:cytochrome c oxidase accessory protein CcoG n=1 Tax=Parvularcula sp. LCG005 TaxID=3078805 RepID=UPI002943B74D|nr:cytochrome c oxidase accessory protein CcoG [Parvularcula sp. LCG005]WOI54170.1 cytochrome c oxidase accessory protein CcoG [Parvularcula sp. LCG005]
MTETVPDEPLYIKREAIHPKLVKGKYRLIKWAVLFLTLGIYYLLPWMRWPRAAHEPDQAVLVDFDGARLYFFNLEIWPDEFYLVTGLLILSALALFLVSAVWGRLWCGFTCPQTVWTDLFIAVERMVEGDRNKRLALAKAPWTAKKITRKIIKHGLWLLIAAMTGGAWVLYFHDAPSVVTGLFRGTAPVTSYLFIVILTFTTYSLAGLMREQVCTYMCPWPRIQGALTDAQTFQVGYYRERGEPRGKHKKGADWSSVGDCIDCNGCVVACPMGIDIRDGDQLECINCGLCVDACDAVMKKIGLPKGLIAYGDDYLTAKTNAERHRLPRLIRPRTIVYAIVLSVVSTLMVFGLTSREQTEFSLERDRAPAFTRLSDGSFRNAVTARVRNKTSESQAFDLAISGPPELQIDAVGHDVKDGRLQLDVDGDGQMRTRLFFVLPADQNGALISVKLMDSQSAIVAEETISFVTDAEGR